MEGVENLEKKFNLFPIDLNFLPGVMQSKIMHSIDYNDDKTYNYDYNSYNKYNNYNGYKDILTLSTIKK